MSQAILFLLGFPGFVSVYSIDASDYKNYNYKFTKSIDKLGKMK